MGSTHAPRTELATELEPESGSARTRLAAAVTAAGGLLLVSRADFGGGLDAGLLNGLLIVGVLVTATLLWWRDTFEARLLVALALSGAAVLGLLALSVGMPGGSGGEVSWGNVSLVLLPAVVAALLWAPSPESHRRSPQGGRDEG